MVSALFMPILFMQLIPLDMADELVRIVFCCTSESQQFSVRR